MGRSCDIGMSRAFANHSYNLLFAVWGWFAGGFSKVQFLVAIGCFRRWVVWRWHAVQICKSQLESVILLLGVVCLGIP